MIRVEVLYFDGCPGHAALMPQLLAVLAGTDAQLELRRVESFAAAERERFLGSPTVRVGGRDVEPGADARTDYGLKCRLYPTSNGSRRCPPDEWLRTALQR